MAAFSNYLEDSITAWINGTTFPAAPTNTYVQLSTNDPTDTGSGGTTLYPRVAVAAGGWTRNSGGAGAGTISNTAIILVSSGSTGGTKTANHVGVFDSLTGGNLLFYGQLQSTLVVNDGDEVRFNAGALQLTIA